MDSEYVHQRYTVSVKYLNVSSTLFPVMRSATRAARVTSLCARCVTGAVRTGNSSQVVPTRDLPISLTTPAPSSSLASWPFGVSLFFMFFNLFRHKISSTLVNGLTIVLKVIPYQLYKLEPRLPCSSGELGIIFFKYKFHDDENRKVCYLPNYNFINIHLSGMPFFLLFPDFRIFHQSSVEMKF